MAKSHIKSNATGVTVGQSRSEFQWTTTQIADALGYVSTSSVDKALQQGGGTVAKLTTLSQIIGMLGITPAEEDEDEVPPKAAGAAKKPPVTELGKGA